MPRQHGDRHRAHARLQRDVACTAVGKVECDPAAGDDCDAASDHVFGDQVRLSESYHDDLCLIEER
jgi:hypothetical protein